MPVSGLDEAMAQSVLFALRQAAGSEEVAKVPVFWLAALELAQIASDKLLRDMEQLERALQYWQGSGKGGGHVIIMFLRRGPVVLFRQLKAALQVDNEVPPPISPTDMIEQRVRWDTVVDHSVMGYHWVMSTLSLCE
ncbi:unnamed protein product [Ostreobium quekettii]|uniref:Uncharacterized protein n=1 Tax=Ostreobium quekettii TaxID=121088 RepID=A0A8S1IRE8_9CHLO|nr:unnamed protein product [Ostreobium quekettii]